MFPKYVEAYSRYCFFSEENKQIQVPNTPSKKQKKKITIYNELQDGFGLRVVGQVDGAVTGHFLSDHIFCCHLNHGFSKDCMHFGFESEFSNTI